MKKPAKPDIASGPRSAIIATAVLVTLAELIGDGTLGLLIGFICFLLALYVMASIPIRTSMLGLTFLALMLPNPAEGKPTEWLPPYSWTGKAVLNHLNTIDRSGPLGAVPVSLMEVFFFALFVIYKMRGGARSRLDGDKVPTPKPLLQFAYLSLGTTAFCWVRGLVLMGGDFGMSLWQVNAVVYLPIIFLLMQASLRGPKDHVAIAKTFLAAAAYRAALAIYVVQTSNLPIDPETGSDKPVYATSHSDSLVFASAVVLVLALLLERFDKTSKRLAFFMLPLLGLGMIANNRRLVWVQVALVLVMVFLVSRETFLKRLIRRVIFISIPIAAIYVTAGWNSTSGRLFKPVQMIRSVVDAESDSSSQWREFENYNIITTFRYHPIMGTGYGVPFEEFIVLPTVSYSLERYIPHNSLLGLWAFTGTLGFAGLTMLWVSGVYFAMRAYRNTEDRNHRATAIVCFGVLPIFLMQTFGDLGLATWQGAFLMAASITVAGKLAVSVGQWSDKPAGRRRAGAG